MSWKLTAPAVWTMTVVWPPTKAAATGCASKEWTFVVGFGHFVEVKLLDVRSAFHLIAVPRSGGCVEVQLGDGVPFVIHLVVVQLAEVLGCAAGQVDLRLLVSFVGSGHFSLE